MNDRRKHRRYGLREDLFVNIRQKPRWGLGKSVDIIAPIIDINTEGIAFKYLHHQMIGHDQKHISIWLPNLMSTIDRLSIRVVHDKKISKFPNALELRICGSQFADLNIEQVLELKNLIDKHGLAEPAPSVPVEPNPQGTTVQPMVT